MNAKKNEEFERSNICWICGILIDIGDKVTDHCHILVNIEGVVIGLAILTLKLVKKYLQYFII